MEDNTQDNTDDIATVECACESCEKARRTKVENFRAESLPNYEQEYGASRRPDDDPFEGKFYGDPEGPAF